MKKEGVIIGIESTAHTLSIVAITRDKRIVLEKNNFFFPEEGMIPSLVSKNHREVYTHWRPHITQGLKLYTVELVGYSSSIGFSCGLKLAKDIAEDLKEIYGCSLIACPHNEGHLEMVKATFEEEVNSGLYVYVSGSNTQVCYFEGTHITPYFETADIAVGNLFDKFTREAGLGAPGGPIVEKLAESYVGELERLPYPLKQGRFYFSGLLEWLRKQTWDIYKKSFCLQEFVFRAIGDAVERLFYILTGTKNVNYLLFSGGVCQNKKLVSMLLKTASYLGLISQDLETPKYHGDNGLMISLLALKKASKNSKF